MGNTGRAGPLSETTASSLTDTYEVIKALMKRRFAYADEGKFTIQYSKDGRLIIIEGPIENGKDRERYNIFIIKDIDAK